jgi:carbon monoxide dehydrogenase subunit G
MLIEEVFVVKAPIQKVWDFLIDIKSLSSLFPQYIKDIQIIDEKNFVGTVKVKVAFLSATFKGSMTITDIDPPRRLESICKGKAPLVGSTVSQKNYLYLKEISDNETEVRYRSEINVVGRLSTLGERAIRGKAKEIGKEFVLAIKNRLEDELS